MSLSSNMIMSGALDEVVDLERYPLNDLASSRGQELIEGCRRVLAEIGACELPGFLRADAVERAVTEAIERKSLAHRSVVAHTIDLAPAELGAEGGDPLVRGLRTAKSGLAYDHIPAGSVLRVVYESDLFTRFIGLALELEPIYRLADELGALNIMFHDPPDELAWHFDNAEFAVTLMLQPALVGGVFEFVPMLRTPEDANAEGVRRLLDGDRANVRTLHGQPGTLTLFRGHLSPHRVTPAEGPRARINAVLSYSTAPDAMLSPSARALFYGR